MFMLCMNLKHTVAFFFPRSLCIKRLEKSTTFLILLDRNILQFFSCKSCGRSNLQYLLDIIKTCFLRLHLTCLWLRWLLQQKRRHPLCHFFGGNSNMKSLDISKENLMRRQRPL